MDTNVSFDGEKVAAVTPARPEKGVAGALMRMGLVKTRGQANVFLAILAILFIAGSVFLFIQASTDTRVDVPPLPVSTI